MTSYDVSSNTKILPKQSKKSQKVHLCQSFKFEWLNGTPSIATKISKSLILYSEQRRYNENGIVYVGRIA
jgi:hypothetical protein